ncbi:MAG: pyruvate kinase [Ilumatobacteraceae bacterium]
MTRRTKIVATLGPATDEPGGLQALLTAGVDVVRLNLSHGSADEHLERLARVRAAAAELDRPVAVLADLPGPKIRAGRFPEGGTALEAGGYVQLEPGGGPSDAGLIRVEYDTLLDDLAVGDRVILGDGAISMRITERRASSVLAQIETGGRTQGRPGVHLSSERLRLSTPTDDDLRLAETAAAAGVEFVAVSFVRRAVDVEKVRRVVGTRAQLVAKIETSTALAHLDEVVAVSDAVMVARGDLGIDCPLEDVPHLQKHIVRLCVEQGVPVITATQMLESMVSAPSPTRAEVSDVANAVFDGTDALMLSGETAIGQHPSAVVTTMARIAERAESEASYRQWAERLGRLQRRSWESAVEGAAATDRVTSAIAHAASEAALDVGATAILCCTRSGRTARAMARFRPGAQLIGLSPVPRTVRTMAMSWGVDPIAVDTYTTTDEMVWFAVETALTQGRISSGDIVLVLAGAPDRPGTAAADVLRIVSVE